MTQPQVWEGTWEEILPHASEFIGTGKRVMLIVPAGEESPSAPSIELAVPAPNQQMLAILRDIEERHQNRPFTDGSDTPRLLEEARAGAMYGGSTADD